MNSLLPTVQHEEILGEGVVLKHFLVKLSESAQTRTPVAGTKCIKGQLLRKNRVRILRDGVIILDGKFF